MDQGCLELGEVMLPAVDIVTSSGRDRWAKTHTDLAGNANTANQAGKSRDTVSVCGGMDGEEGYLCAGLAVGWYCLWIAIKLTIHKTN